MEILQNNSVHKINRLAILSLVVGILSVLPYSPALAAVLLHAISGSDTLLQIATSIPVTVYGIAGLLLGTTSLMVSGRAMEQIKGSMDEKGLGMVIAGRVFGILGIGMNVLFGFLFVLLLKMSWE